MRCRGTVVKHSVDQNFSVLNPAGAIPIYCGATLYKKSTSLLIFNSFKNKIELFHRPPTVGVKRFLSNFETQVFNPLLQRIHFRLPLLNLLNPFYQPQNIKLRRLKWFYIRLGKPSTNCFRIRIPVENCRERSESSHLY